MAVSLAPSPPRVVPPPINDLRVFASLTFDCESLRCGITNVTRVVPVRAWS